MSKKEKHKRQRFRLQITASTDNLQTIRHFIHELVQKAGFSAEQIDQIELAVDEACTNVIKHAYRFDATKPIDLEIIIDDQKAEIIVTDYGSGFDPEKLPEPDLNHSLKKGRAGGLGIHLMKKVMDDVRFNITPGKKTKVHLIKFKNKR
ncbi:putative anti-sigma regulatory factor, serine/threonine protein kinase [Caldithrix abyssi DSM 13497]|uniref:Putative anti-sigma regulatory factor, serine/threonine protein kinase n=1 Tax=Caldithrix abyssi DSM 13497 TaxID=880073 RepID=H1XTM9_CALAY|nr:ATP-binding protein [Caldithrix abyssi]APF17399.1 serine/threonine-protein kinase RsbW [Caldithrix abyssi DSM 13497]EHO41504.1 putative anti-sigma regulatory factor, serine/threonine protein kinase [Caldithrix abyssi DSM 13497]